MKRGVRSQPDIQCTSKLPLPAIVKVNIINGHCTMYHETRLHIQHVCIYMYIHIRTGLLWHMYNIIIPTIPYVSQKEL